MAIKKIATIEVGASGASSIDFTAIPQTATDLFIVVATRANAGARVRNMMTRFNGSTTGYTERMIDSDGSGTSSASTSGSLINWATENDSASTANTFSNVTLYIPNYTSSSNKSLSIDSASENNQTYGVIRITAAVWANAEAITSVSLLPESGSAFVQYSTATLYSVTKGTLAGVTVS
jgi:hypothetical protein